MSLSRRIFLRTASVVGFTAFIPSALQGIAFGQQTASAGSFPIPTDALQNRLARINKEMFLQTVNTSYRFIVNGRKMDLSLIRVIDMEPASTNAGRSGENFSLVFQGPLEPAILQGTYTVKHERFGKISLFIVPGDTKSRYGLNYEAIVNRLPE